MFEITEPKIGAEDFAGAALEGARRGPGPEHDPTRTSRDMAFAENMEFGPVEIQPISLQPAFTPHANDQYHVNDLLRYHDRNFIQNAYLAILKRGPDATGYRAFMDSLRSGRLNKLDVLARLRYSREGRSKRVRIEGLFVPAALRFSYRIPVLGYILQLAVAMARLPSHLRGQQQFEAHVMAQHEQLAEHANQIALHLVNHSRGASERLDTLAKEMESGLRVAREETGKRFEQVWERFTARLDEEMERLVLRLNEEHESGQRRLDELAAKSANRESALRAEIERTFQKEQEIRMELALQGQRLSRLLEEIRRTGQRARQPETISQEASGATASNVLPGEESHELDALYAALENRFRGTDDEIKERLRVYLPLLTESGLGTRQKPVLDVACGRGEWLELLRDEDLTSRGVDSNRALVAECRARGLEVYEDDLMNYLRRTPDASLGAVTGFHIVEHLPVETLVNMLDEVVRALVPGGAAIFETPNPQNVLVGSCNFYFDPTHRNPLPAPVMQFFLESRGLVGVRVIKLNPSTAEPVQGDSDLVRRFNEYFYGSMDYAVVGWKS